VHTLSIEFLEQSQTALVHYPDRNTEAQAYIYMSETFSAQGENMKAYHLKKQKQNKQKKKKKTKKTTPKNLVDHF
jgi:hypothetical protein